MICASCSKEAEHKAWCIVWLTAYNGPIPVCKACLPYYTKFLCVLDDEAEKRWKEVKFYLNFTHEQEFYSLRDQIIEEGEILRGCPEITLFSRILMKYKSEFWIVQRDAVVNMGTSTYWFDKLEWR